MKKEEFNILKQGYKEDLRNNLKKPLEKIDKFYEDKRYIGTPEMIQEASKTDSKNKQNEIRAEIKERSLVVGKFHFNGLTKAEAGRIVKEEGRAKTGFNKSASTHPESFEYKRNLKSLELNKNMKDFPKNKTKNREKGMDPPER